MSSNNSSPDLTKQRLTDLRNGLLGLHKTLLDSERAHVRARHCSHRLQRRAIEAGALRSMVRVAARAVGIRGADR